MIARIFYRLNRKRDDKITVGELRRGKFVDHLAKLEKEEDINKVINNNMAWEQKKCFSCAPTF